MMWQSITKWSCQSTPLGMIISSRLMFVSFKLSKNEKRYTCKGASLGTPRHSLPRWLVSHKMQIVPFSKWECSLMRVAHCHTSERREALEEAAVLKSLREQKSPPDVQAIRINEKEKHLNMKSSSLLRRLFHFNDCRFGCQVFASNFRFPYWRRLNAASAG